MLRIEQARADAEREVGLRLEAAEATERARHLIQIEVQRRADELDLRRAEIAKRRPTWMVVVTGLAVSAGLALTWFAVDRAGEADAANAAAEQMRKDRTRAVAELQQSRDELAKIHHRLDDVEVTLAAAVKAVGTARTDADRQLAPHRDSKTKVNVEVRTPHNEIRPRLDMASCSNTPTGCLDKR